MFSIVCVLVAFEFCVNDTVAFNLENRLPIVKYGDADTYFGYSVAGHIIGEKDDAQTEKWWVSRARSLYHFAFI